LSNFASLPFQAKKVESKRAALAFLTCQWEEEFQPSLAFVVVAVWDVWDVAEDGSLHDEQNCARKLLKKKYYCLFSYFSTIFFNKSDFRLF
jgi:hypothetical protein